MIAEGIHLRFDKNTHTSISELDLQGLSSVGVGSSSPSPLHVAASSGSIDIVVLLMMNGADVDATAPLPTNNIHIHNSLNEVQAKKSQPIVVEGSSGSGGGYLNTTDQTIGDQEELTVLEVAERTNNISVVRYLRRKNDMRKSGKTAPPESDSSEKNNNDNKTNTRGVGGQDSSLNTDKQQLPQQEEAQQQAPSQQEVPLPLPQHNVKDLMDELDEVLAYDNSNNESFEDTDVDVANHEELEELYSSMLPSSSSNRNNSKIPNDDKDKDYHRS